MCRVGLVTGSANPHWVTVCSGRIKIQIISISFNPLTQMHMLEKRYNPCKQPLVLLIVEGEPGQPHSPVNQKVCGVLEAFLSFDKFPGLAVLSFQPLPGLPAKIKRCVTKGEYSIASPCAFSTWLTTEIHPYICVCIHTEMLVRMCVCMYVCIHSSYF